MANLTTNYGFTKPVVGGDTDAWGGELNTDLDMIDSAIFAVSAAVIGDNRIINGDMRINQRGATSGGSATGYQYTIDRWAYNGTQASKGTWGQFQPGASEIGQTGFSNTLGFSSSSAYTVIASDYFGFWQGIEADQITDFAWGTTGAKPVTLSFWAQATLTGTFGGVIQNYAGTRTYVFTYSLPNANVWTKIVLTIPGDTVGAWVLNGNAGAAYLIFDISSGSTWRGPGNAWASANYVGATGSVNVVGTNGASWYVTGVKLEIGTVATPFNRQSLAKSLADCQRYYQGATNIGMYAGGVAGQWLGQTVNLPVTMRATPTIVYGTVTYTNSGSIGTTNILSTCLLTYVIATTTAGTGFTTTYTASAEL